MIVSVKRNRKQKIIKIASLVAVVIMFIAYYFHMENEFKLQQEKELQLKKAEKLKIETKLKKKKELERTLLSEIEKTVDLIGQKYINHIKIVEDKIVIICEPNTNLEALMIRYGSMALVKESLKETIIAIDLKYIVESRINEK
ncbi:hypothetical protein [Poseidonibacter sp.]|uniref:hypothetical protein n=1 Tax=Poseidonibacter sp. TaxID=2321188 RepID=UPI00359DDFB3